MPRSQPKLLFYEILYLKEPLLGLFAFFHFGTEQGGNSLKKTLCTHSVLLCIISRKNSKLPNVLKEKSLLFSNPSSSIHTRLTDSVIFCFPEASTRHCTDQITSNFLTHASWRLYEIRQLSTCLCTTSILLSNTTIGTFRQVIRGDIQQIPLDRNSAGVSNRQTIVAKGVKISTDQFSPPKIEHEILAVFRVLFPKISSFSLAFPKN